MSLDKLSAQLANNKQLPPVELWDPPYCGEIDIHIKANGDWYHEGRLFKRLALVKMFASVLIKAPAVNAGHSNSDYFLVTPAEKVKIRVDDAPFVLTNWCWLDQQKSIMQVSTNLEDVFILDNNHPLIVSEEGNLYVTVRRNLVAKVHRNVYYQWADIAQEKQTQDGTELSFFSAGSEFILGTF